MSHTLILTGASRGIGASIAKIFLDRNPNGNLVAVARSTGALESLQKEYGERVTTLSADIADPESAKKAVSLALENYGSIDSIIANAGVLDPVGPIADADVKAWRRLYEINFFSVVELVQLALPHLKKSKGKIVVVSSGASTSAYHGWAAYGSSKAALNHFIRHIAVENDDVRALSFAPGVVDTAMQKDIREVFGAKMPEDSLKKFTDLHKNDQLLPPDVPATYCVNFVLKKWSKGMSGEYFRVGDESLKAYSS